MSIYTCLIGGDRIGWALDMELKLTRRSFSSNIQTSNIFQNDVLHAIHWKSLLNVPRELLIGRRVLSHLTHAPEAAFSQTEFGGIEKLVQLWVVRSSQAQQAFNARGLRNMLIPYAYDPSVFFPVPRNDPRLHSLRARWNIPMDAFLVGSFQRDTEGSDLRSPKLVKGPDIFLECADLLKSHLPDLHILLAGPRRFWLKRKLEERGIPYTYIGREMPGDDINHNTLPQETINLLYNLLDVYLVTSRMEGGPQAVLETCAANCLILSTAVGHAEDFLHPDCIFGSPQEIVEKICGEGQFARLLSTIPHNSKAVERATLNALRPLWDQVYNSLMRMPAISVEDAKFQPRAWQVALNRLKGRE